VVVLVEPSVEEVNLVEAVVDLVLDVVVLLGYGLLCSFELDVDERVVSA